MTGVRSVHLNLKSGDLEMNIVARSKSHGDAVESPIDSYAHHANIEAVRVIPREIERAFMKEEGQCDD